MHQTRYELWLKNINDKTCQKKAEKCSKRCGYQLE